MGLFASWHRLPRLIGLSRATEMVLTGSRYEADLLETWGLVRTADDALAEAVELGTRIASRAPLSARALTRALRFTFDVSNEDGGRHQRETFARLRATSDHAEAVAAFLEKRTPRFTGQ